ncbi:hypothetical protein Tco_0087421 [Tanacetum coccineum]
MHFIPKRKDEIAVVEATYAMRSMIVKNIENDGMAHERGEECGFDSKEDEVVPKVKDVSLVDGVFDGALGGDGDEDFAIGEGGLYDEAWVKAMEEEEEEENYDKDDEQNEKDGYLIKMRMMDDRRRKKREQKWNDNLFSCHNPFASFAHSEEREDA